MTTKEHIDFIRVLGNKISDDWLDKVQDKFIYDVMKISRLKVLKDQASKWRLITNQNKQILCVDLHLDYVYENCNCNGVGCKVLKSFIKLPQIFSNSYKYFMKVTDVYNSGFVQAKFDTEGYSRNKKKTPKFDIIDNYLIIFDTDKSLKKVVIEAVFNDPLSLEIADSYCSINNCFDILTTDYPLDEKLLDTFYKVCIENLLIQMKLPEDTLNDERISSREA